MATNKFVLRTVYIDPEVDELLRNEAFKARSSKNDLYRKYLELGIRAAKAGFANSGRRTALKQPASPGAAKKVAKTAPAKKASPARPGAAKRASASAKKSPAKRAHA